MKVSRFELERWQSIWENQVELNISESGVEPLPEEELVEDNEKLHELLTLPLAWEDRSPGSPSVPSSSSAPTARWRPRVSGWPSCPPSSSDSLCACRF